jgi:hypothetical protein
VYQKCQYKSIYYFYYSHAFAGGCMLALAHGKMDVGFKKEVMILSVERKY